MKRISVPLTLLLLFVLACPTLVADHAVRGGATASPDHVTLTWTGNPETSMTVTWRTDTKISVGFIEYQEGALSDSARRQKAHASDFKTDLESTRLFTAKLTGLSPDTKYSYRVGDGEHWSAVHTFSTAESEARAFEFLVFGDSQSGADGVSPYRLWRITLHNAYKANPNAKFFINMGDLVDVGQSGAHWNAWFAAAAGVIDTIPEMPVVGNHETNGSIGSGKPVYWDAQFALPQNGPAGLKTQVYSFDYGPVHFVELDSQQSEERTDTFTPQRAWLDADLAASKATWKIVMFHKTPYDLKPDRTNESLKNAFSPIIERRHVDLVFNGHDHAIGRTYPIHDGENMRKPSQGTVYFVVGRSGSKTYSDTLKKPWNTYFYNPLDQPNYLVVDVVGKKLTIKTVKQDGTPLDTFFIDKKNDVDSDIRN